MTSGSPGTTSPCGGCGLDEPETEFYHRSNGSRQYPCKKCQLARHKEEDRYDRRFRRKKSMYGISRDQWEQLFIDQGGVCAICGDSPARISTDHDHTTGLVRGLLCTSCNLLLGLLEKNKERLPEFFEYLGWN